MCWDASGDPRTRRLIVEGGGELDVAREELGNAVLDLTCIQAHTNKYTQTQKIYTYFQYIVSTCQSPERYASSQ
jgi:hypothetical protein